MKKVKNIFSELPSAQKDEVFDILLKQKNIKIERITSLGQATPKGKWLREKTDEWVIVLQGKAKLKFAENPALCKPKGLPYALNKGDYIFIPAGTPHRVEWSDPKQKTVWLAIHF